MSQQFAYAVPLDVVKPPALAVLVNFGVVAGRKPTRPELEELARGLREAVRAVTIVDEQRLEVGEELDVLLEQVRIEVGDAALAVAGTDPLELRARLIAIAEEWVSRCADHTGDNETLAERIARQAVVDQGGEPPSA